MKKLTRKAKEFIYQAVDSIFSRSGIKDARLCEPEENPFMYFIASPVANGEGLIMKTSNELFHALGLLPEGRNLALDEDDDYCYVIRSEQNYITAFNHPAVFQFEETDPECQFILKNWNQDGGDNGGDDDAKSEIDRLVDGIKAGRLKSKSDDGYLVLKAEFYNAIEAGKKKVEYRDFTEYNLKRTIGLKTIRFNLGYAKDAKRMRWEVKKVVLLDDEDNECDPFNVPEDFRPTTIAIHLGKRIG